jgi:hypothetical protein
VLVCVCSVLSVADVENSDEVDTECSVNKVYIYVMDTPTINTLNSGFYTAALKFSSDGTVIPEFSLGVLKRLNLGVKLKLGKFIGGGRMNVDWPALTAKYRIYDGSIIMPGIAVGCDLDGCFSNDDYYKKGKGLYVVAGREIFIDNLMLSVGVNINKLSKFKVYGFANATVPLYKEKVCFMTEYDNVNNWSSARLNFGLRIALTKHVDLDFIIRDCWGKGGKRIPNERLLKIGYSGKF